MQWFKHDADANMDAKLQQVLLDYGLEGYGLYWYCIELITSKLDKDNLTFELEHDSRIIARNTGSTQQRVEEMMRRFVELNLFDQNGGNIRCLKLLKRLDSSMTNSKQMREFIVNAKKCHDAIMTSPDNVMLEENRIEENRIEKKDKSSTSADALATKIIDLWNTIKNTEKTNWQGVDIKTKKRITLTNQRIKLVKKRLTDLEKPADESSIIQWFTDFMLAMAKDPWYSGRQTGYRLEYGQFMAEDYFVKTIERLNGQ